MSNEYRENLAKNIKHLRIKNGMFQQDLADKLGVTQKTVSAWETARKEPESINMLYKLCEVFRVQLDELLDHDLTTYKIFKSTKDAVMYLLNQQEVSAMGGFDPNKMTEEEIIKFAEDVQRMVKILAIEKQAK